MEKVVEEIEGEKLSNALSSVVLWDSSRGITQIDLNPNIEEER